MTIDIAEGDILVVADREYPIKFVAEWDGLGATMSFRRQAKINASTKRSDSVDGKRSRPSAWLTGLKITPIDPLDPVATDLVKSAGLETPQKIKQCYCADATSFVHLFIEDKKR